MAERCARLFRGLQAMAIQEFLKSHPVEWNLAQVVYKWLNDFAISEEELEDMSALGAAMQRSKACLAMFD